MTKPTKTNPFSSIETAIATLKKGGMIILVDDESRENEGDLIIPAATATAEQINFMCQFGRCPICVPMTGDALDRLHIPMMSARNNAKFSTAFTVSVDASKNTSTGVSAAERAYTIRTLAAANSTPNDLVMPGHIFPLRALPGGVKVRAGHTEGSVDLMRLANLSPAAALCEIMSDDGTMARLPQLIEFSQHHQLPLVCIQHIIDYLEQHPLSQAATPYNSSHLLNTATTQLPLRDLGQFTIKTFSTHLDNTQHIALIHGDLDAKKPCLVRLHSECLTGDLFGSLRCDCGEQLDAALQQISQTGGVLLYLRQEGRGIGLVNKLKAYALQDQGLDTVEANQHLGFPADGRDYLVGAQMLQQLGIQSIRLLTNNPCKVAILEQHGIDIVTHEPLQIEPNPYNQHYLKTKQKKLGHWLI